MEQVHGIRRIRKGIMNPFAIQYYLYLNVVTMELYTYLEASEEKEMFLLKIIPRDAMRESDIRKIIQDREQEITEYKEKYFPTKPKSKVWKIRATKDEWEYLMQKLEEYRKENP